MQEVLERKSIKNIDFNCDLAQAYGIYKNNTEFELLDYVSSVNVSCGFHAGDPMTIKNALLKAKDKKIYLLSNAQRGFTENELKMFGLDKYFDGIVIEQTHGDSGDMPYSIDGDGKIKIYAPYGEDKYVEMFICEFIKDEAGKNCLEVTDCFSALGGDSADKARFYNVDFGKDNEMMTKLIFERWTDYNYPIQKKGESFNLRQKSIVEKAQQDVTFFGFLSYYDSTSNLFVSSYKESMKYQAEHIGATYSVDLANRSVSISGFGSADKNGKYVFNEDYTQLYNAECGCMLYRFTDFAGGVTSETNYSDIELVSFEDYKAEMESLMAKAS